MVIAHPARHGITMRKLILAVVLVALVPLPALAGSTGTFMSLFVTTCMKHLHSQDALRSQLTDNPVLSSKEAAQFLAIEDGTAWMVARDGRKYFVALRKGSQCAVYTHRGSASRIFKDFVTIVQDAPEPLVAIKQTGGARREGSLKL